MNIDDIEMFPRASYTVTVMWSFLENKLERWAEDVSFQLNPNFQRGHVWTKAQQISYVEFIVRGGVSGKDIFFNCPGWMGSFKGPLVCVDGLQRLTAVQKFLQGKLPVFGGHYPKDIKGMYPISHDYSLTFHVNNIEDNAQLYKWFLWMNEGGTPHTKKSLARVRSLLDKIETT